jgi:hypothetical protein
MSQQTSRNACPVCAQPIVAGDCPSRHVHRSRPGGPDAGRLMRDALNRARVAAKSREEKLHG